MAGWEVEVDEEGRILDSRRGERVITHGSVQSRDSREYMLLNQDAFPTWRRRWNRALIRISGEEAKEYQLLAEGRGGFCPGRRENLLCHGDGREGHGSGGAESPGTDRSERESE